MAGISLETGVSVLTHTAIKAVSGSGVSGIGVVGAAIAAAVNPASGTTFNPDYKGTSITLSNGDLTATKSAVSWNSVAGIAYHNSGKRYFEVVIDATTAYFRAGVVTNAALAGGYIGDNTRGWGLSEDGQKWTNGVGAAYNATTFPVGTVIGVKMDFDTGELAFTKDGAALGVAFTGLSGILYPMISEYLGGSAMTARFLPSSWTTTPSGYTSWGDGFVAGQTPGTTFNPSDKFGAVTLSGGNLTMTNSDGSLRSVKGVTSYLSGVENGKRYAEFLVVAKTTEAIVGVGRASESNTYWPGLGAQCVGYSSTGERWKAGANAAYGATYTAGDVIGMLTELNAGTVEFFKNGVSQGSIAVPFQYGVAYYAMVAANTATVTFKSSESEWLYPPAAGNFPW